MINIIKYTNITSNEIDINIIKISFNIIIYLYIILIYIYIYIYIYISIYIPVRATKVRQDRKIKLCDSPTCLELTKNMSNIMSNVSICLYL